jgi:radical SAM-linked protein
MKVRVRYSKLGKVRFVGNLDVTRIWERALRKAAIPVAYSTGFSPRPRLSFGLALPMAAGSVAEYVDIELVGEFAVAGLAQRLTEALPEGFDVMALSEKFPGQVSLQQDVVACDWEIVVDDNARDALGASIDAALAAPALLLERERKGERSTDDIRPCIEGLWVDTADPAVLHARLATIGRGVRPAELAAVLLADFGGSEAVRGVTRIEQWIERDGARRELLPVPGAVAAPTELVGA